MEPSPGDKVEVILPKIKYEGIFLESPLNEKNIILIKLKSGYNIGLNRRDILSVNVLQKSKDVFEEKEIKVNPNKPNIGMVMTGGTIASSFDSKTGGVDPLTSPSKLFEFYPELFEKVNVLKIDVPFMKASEDMDFKDWKKISKSVADLLNDPKIEGVIVTHGTDFLHYTSAALSFFLNNVNKPVVLTYSQRSVDRASSDANLNLRCSAVAALSDMAEVVLVGHSSTEDDFCFVMPGTKVRKLHSSKRDAFKVVNAKPIAKVYSDKFVRISSYKVRHNSKVKVDDRFEEKIAIIKIYPGQDPDILNYYLKKGYKGLVLEVTGLAHVPSKKARLSWLKNLKEVISKGMVVCATAQTIYGRLNPYVYSNGREILDTGVIYLEDMLSETAFVKLGWVLGHKEWAQDKEIVKEKMLKNFSNEFNERIEF